MGDELEQQLAGKTLDDIRHALPCRHPIKIELDKLEQARRQGWEQCQREAKDKAEAFAHAGKLCCMEKADKIKDAIAGMEYKGVEKTV